MADDYWTIADDQKTATINFPTSPPVTLNVSTSALEEMVNDLGYLRYQMEPEVAESYQEGAEPVPNPAWEVGVDESKQNILLHIRDPRFGWLLYAIPLEEARKLSQYLAE